MARPLKDIIAELEAKYEGSELKNDLMQRRLIIGSYQLHMEYLMMQMRNYEDDVKRTVEFNLSASIISRITLNLLIVMVRTYNRIPAYRDSLERYLLDEEYDENYKNWEEFEKYGKEIEKLIFKLQENNIFAIDEIDKDDALQNHHIIEGFNGQVPPLVNFEQRLAYMNGNELLSCLQYMINILRKEITDLKMIALLRDDDMMEEIYDLNYLLYAKRYWPDKVANFRSHISRQYFNNRETPDELDKLRIEHIREFEKSSCIGEIWCNYSEDKINLAIDLKRKGLNDSQWEEYFENVFKIEEYSRWIDELEENNKPRKTIRDFVPRHDIADVVFDKIKSHIQKAKKPKEIVKPFRAAYDAGVLERPTWDAFVADFGKDMIKSETSFNSYTNPESKPYSGPAYDVIVGDFKKLLE